MDDDTLLVACLCAQWCNICRDWRVEFEALARRFPDARFVWVDVEDDADRLGDYDPDNFPVLALQRGPRLLYCATQAQHAPTWQRMIDAYAAGTAPPCAPPTTLDLRALV